MSGAELFIISLLAATFRLATPILLAALGEAFAERAGVINIGLEGMMLAGAFAGAIGAYWTGSPHLGLLAGAVFGCQLALLHAVLTISLRVDQIISGVALNLLSLGLTGFLARALFGIQEAQRSVPALGNWEIPGLMDLPVLGPSLFSQGALVYLALALAPCCALILHRTSWGLKVRAVGEFPDAAESAGISVVAIRYQCVLVGGLLAGLGGSFLSLGYLNFFAENMTAGRGFIALAAVILGRWEPVGIAAAALLFGGADAAQLRLQSLLPWVPNQFLLMFPYAAALVVLAFGFRRSGAPAALGIPYARGGS